MIDLARREKRYAQERPRKIWSKGVMEAVEKKKNGIKQRNRKKKTRYKNV